MPRIRGVYGKEPLTCIVSIPLRIAPSMLFPHRVISSARRIAPHGAQEWLSPDMLLQPPACFLFLGPGWYSVSDRSPAFATSRIWPTMPCYRSHVAQRHDRSTRPKRFGLGSPAYLARQHGSLVASSSQSRRNNGGGGCSNNPEFLLCHPRRRLGPGCPLHTSPAEQQLARARNDWRPC